MSGNRIKKNVKKNKFANTPEVLQVKSGKLDTNRNSNKNSKSNAKSEDNLRKVQRIDLKNSNNFGNEPISENINRNTENNLTENLNMLSLNNENGNNNIPSTSKLKASLEEPNTNSKKPNTSTDELPLVMEYFPSEPMEKVEDFAGSYKYYTKNTKSIKFTNQVTVLYFNGDDILCESMEPLKKEQEQQLRNKEMRKEHLMSKGQQIDNLYLF